MGNRGMWVGLKPDFRSAEVGNMALPKKLLAAGVRDMVRISDARMSGTAFGTVVLHAAPEAAVGGPLALVGDGDMVEIDVGARRLHLEAEHAELARWREGWRPRVPEIQGGYQHLYVEHVLQANQGADLDFLVGCRGAAVPRESHRGPKLASVRRGRRSLSEGNLYIDDCFMRAHPQPCRLGA